MPECEKLFIVNEFNYGRFILRFRKPLRLFPTKDESGNLLCLKYPDLGIHVFAETKEQLLEELQEQVLFLWDDYALGNDDEMTLQAQILKKNLLEAIEIYRPNPSSAGVASDIPSVSITSLFGKVKSCFNNCDEADAFLRAERDAWE